MIPNALLITGTDTDAGKTVLTTALIAYWQKYCQSRSLGVMKPLQTGVGDRELYRQLFELDQTPEELNPLHFEAPLAPPIAADLEGKRVALEPVWKAFEALRRQRDFVLVEALGGLGSPVTHETTVADWAWDWHLPAVLVVPVRLGAIGQAVANVALARQSKVHLKGIVLNCIRSSSDEEIENWASVSLIERLTGIPVLGLLPYLSDPTDVEKLAQAAANLDLERLIPDMVKGFA
ncbi:ATP-dependent dethiobiotin synthetase BioD [Cyanobacteria bacterium FACHB-DQ100]|uniref:dethiobiotin synthase n=1 Tax=unclassified Leptolyngbya TaxID=2650499 RepID=UPI00168082EF|nr:dethiobiotin synthase [Leptolyngbya sp. FACHB-17]MBD1824462.1 ATP-dependent dethiobiotin synthetase BioD [Cyanobacteria bacterium FACHB-DQ100]MBD2081016.1 ATP-dependent dethiobiotin synthetase BioD [Leptolyngbya sp. FACHB-17]